MGNKVSETTSSLVKTGNKNSKEFNKKADQALDEQIELVVSAWEKLYEYFKSVVKTGLREYVEVPNIWVYWLNTDKDRGHFSTRFFFRDGEFEIYESSYASHFEWRCGCTCREDLEKQKAILRDKYSREHRYAVKRLVSNWSTIKPQIEEAINRLMTEKMQNAENRLNDVLEMNEQLANFVA